MSWQMPVKTKDDIYTLFIYADIKCENQENCQFLMLKTSQEP